LGVIGYQLLVIGVTTKKIHLMSHQQVDEKLNVLTVSSKSVIPEVAE
jgi:hypothetical protein